MPKAKPLSKKTQAAMYSALFTAIVMIVFSMMVISQSNGLQAAFGRVGFGNSQAANDQKQIAALQNQLALDQRTAADARAISDAREIQYQNDESKLSQLLEVADLDTRLLGGLIVVTNQGQMLSPTSSQVLVPTSSQVLVRRTSPSGQQTMVIYGDKTSNANVAHGLFVRIGSHVFSGLLYWTEEIRNVRWKDEHTILFDLISASGAKILQMVNT